MSRHPGHWCQTTLHYRGWSFDEITTILGHADIIDHFGKNKNVTAHYFAIEKVLEAEPRLETHRTTKRIVAEIRLRIDWENNPIRLALLNNLSPPVDNTTALE